ncbi:MAG: substrate-binding periplasmic protein [Parachlamydiales bacterium]
MKRLLLLLCLLLACCSPSRSGAWKVARDPNWFPNNFPGREVEVTAFSDALSHWIANEEGLRLELYPASWSHLQRDLSEGLVDGILTAFLPVGGAARVFDFSESYLATGPVLVVPKGSPIRGIEGLSGHEVGIVLGSSDLLLLSSVPDLLVTHFGTFSDAVLACWRGEVEAVLIPALLAYTYTADFYADKLEVVTEPLGDRGLRLVTLKGKGERLIGYFNKGLKRAIESGTYEELRTEWHLGPVIN